MASPAGAEPTKKRAAATSSLLTQSGLMHEEEVVWPENPENLGCVREAPDKTKRRNTGPPHAQDSRMAGYALLADEAAPDPGNGPSRRRVFFLLPHDRGSLPDGLHREGAR
ncbi:DUF6009 family protein [Streptomyces misionensis]